MFVKTKNIDLIKLDLNCLLFLFYFISFGIYGALTPSVSMIAKNLLYKEFGRNLYYVDIVFHNNHVLGNALLHKEKN